MTRIACLFLLLAGCITPPAVRPAGSTRIVLGRYPPGSQEVRIAVGPDVALRGVFVPAEPGAPVVIHLLGSQGSVTMDYAARLFSALRDRGLASLAVDYEGVGASGGDRSPDHLRRDARAIHAEGVRRAGGAAHVVIRGTSIGTLAAGSLLEDRAGAAAVVLFSPVRGETVARNWLYENWWDLFAFLVAPLLETTTDVDLVGALRGASLPLLVVAPERDSLLPADEAEMVAGAVREAGGALVRRKGASHLGVAVSAFDVTEEEDVLYARLFPGIPPVQERVACVLAALPDGTRARFRAGTSARRALEQVVSRRRHEPPALAAALALAAATDPGRPLLRWLRGMPPARLASLPFDALAALVDFGDPAGDLDPRELYAMQRERAETPAPNAVVRFVRDGRWDRRARWEVDGLGFFSTLGVATTSADLDEDPQTPAGGPARLALPRTESLRQAVRLALKAAGIPDRMRRGALEAWHESGWRRVGLASIPEEGFARSGAAQR